MIVSENIPARFQGAFLQVLNPLKYKTRLQTLTDLSLNKEIFCLTKEVLELRVIWKFVANRITARLHNTLYQIGKLALHIVLAFELRLRI